MSANISFHLIKISTKSSLHYAAWNAVRNNRIIHHIYHISVKSFIIKYVQYNEHMTF